MAAGIRYIPITLNSSGVASVEINAFGLVTSIRIERSSGSPVVTISDDVDTIVDGVTFSSDRTVYPRAANEDVDGVAIGTWSPFSVAGNVTIAITGGASNGTVNVRMKVL